MECFSSIDGDPPYAYADQIRWDRRLLCTKSADCCGTCSHVCAAHEPISIDGTPRRRRAVHDYNLCFSRSSEPALEMLRHEFSSLFSQSPEAGDLRTRLVVELQSFILQGICHGKRVPNCCMIRDFKIIDMVSSLLPDACMRPMLLTVATPTGARRRGHRQLHD
jgi:hypothetical protein